MPFVWRNKTGRPRMTATMHLSKMSMDELIAYEAFLWECMEKLPNSPSIANTMNAIYREVEWRAQDTAFR